MNRRGLGSGNEHVPESLPGKPLLVNLAYHAAGRHENEDNASAPFVNSRNHLFQTLQISKESLVRHPSPGLAQTLVFLRPDFLIFLLVLGEISVALLRQRQ